MSKHITREMWAAAGDFSKAAQPGDTVDEQIVNDFRDCVPPASMSSGYLQVGEAYDHMVDENGRSLPRIWRNPCRGTSSSPSSTCC